MQCRSPAVRGRSVCRMHGAGGGAPVGNRNARKHGRYGRRAIEMRRAIADLLRKGRDLVERM
jgi:glucans biosynthesis protein